MVGRRTAAVTGLAALLLTGASLLGPNGSAATTRASASKGTSVAVGQDHHGGPHAEKLDKLHKLDKHAQDDGTSDAPGSDSADNGSGTISGTPAPVTGQSSGEPSVGGAQATTNGADGNEALAASTAPTPPNGAEPPAVASPGAADTSPVATDAVVGDPADAATDAAAPAATPPAPDGGLLDDFDRVIGATGPKPVAAGLSPDATRPGVLVAMLAFAVLLFLVGYQLVDRRDPRRDATRDAEAVARFR